MTTQPTCEERIGQALARELEDLRIIIDALRNTQDEDAWGAFCKEYGCDQDMDLDDRQDALQAAIVDRVLAVSEYKVFKVELSWGGPADWFEVWTQEGKITRIIYHFADWFDHAEREIEGEEFELVAEWARDLIDLDA